MSLPAATVADSPVLGPPVTAQSVESYLRAVPPVDEVGVSERAGAPVHPVGEAGVEARRARSRHPHVRPDHPRRAGHSRKVIQLASKAVRPDPGDPTIPPVAALCVYPNMVPYAVEALQGSGVAVASVATYFPSGQAPISVKTADVSLGGQPGCRRDRHGHRPGGPSCPVTT